VCELYVLDQEKIDRNRELGFLGGIVNIDLGGSGLVGRHQMPAKSVN